MLNGQRVPTSIEAIDMVVDEEEAVFEVIVSVPVTPELKAFIVNRQKLEFGIVAEKLQTE